MKKTGINMLIPHEHFNSRSHLSATISVERTSLFQLTHPFGCDLSVIGMAKNRLNFNSRSKAIYAAYFFCLTLFQLTVHNGMTPKWPTGSIIGNFFNSHACYGVTYLRTYLFKPSKFSTHTFILVRPLWNFS